MNGSFTKRVFQLIPFLILFGFIAVTWIQSLTTHHNPTYEHAFALGALTINLIAYLINFKSGLIITLVVLLLGTVSLISITYIHVSHSYYVGRNHVISTPDINLTSLLILIAHLIINGAVIKSILSKWLDWFAPKLK